MQKQTHTLCGNDLPETQEGLNLGHTVDQVVLGIIVVVLAATPLLLDIVAGSFLAWVASADGLAGVLGRSLLAVPAAALRGPAYDAWPTWLEHHACVPVPRLF